MVRRLLCLSAILAGGLASLLAQQGSPPITMADAIARAVAQHPALSAARLEGEARAAEVAQATRRPNPTLSADVEDLGRTVGSAMPSQTTVSVAQRFELGNKRGVRTTLAELERTLADWDLTLARSDLEARVAQVFIDGLAADAELSLARADAETTREMAAAVEARVNAGVAAPPELDRAQAAASMARVQAVRVEEARRSAIIALTSAWGSPSGEEVALAGGLEAGVTVPPLATLELALEESPTIARWTTELARREKVVSSVKAGKVPDVDVGAGYRRLHDSESHAWVLGATFSLPLFDKQSDRLTAAQLRVNAARQERSSALAGLRAGLLTAHSAATSAQAALVELDQRVIPLSERAASAVQEGYQAGRFSLLEVLEARRGLADARKDRVRTLAELHRALITIQHLLGVTPVLAPSRTQGDRQ